MNLGTVRWFDADKGYGFISADDGGPDVFVHYKAIAVQGYRSLQQNQRVSFDAINGDKGRYAENVKPYG